MARDSDKRKVGLVVLIVLIVLSFIISIVAFGAQKTGRIILTMLVIIIVIGVIATIIYAGWWLFFKKQKYDATYINSKNLKKAGRMSKPPNMKNLYLSGDKGHSRVKIGRVSGYCRIQIMKKKGDEKQKENLEKEEQDVFIVAERGFPMNLFDEEIIIRTRPEDHDELIGDVTLNGFSILPISEYWFLNNDYLDVREIDFTILKEAQRGIFFEHLKDSKEILDKAIGLDSGHKKEIEKKNLYEIPEMGGPAK